jgi:hypothetical protein
MNQLLAKTKSTQQKTDRRTYPSNQSDQFDQRKSIQQELRQRIHEALQAAQMLPPADRRTEIRQRLLAIQTFCDSVHKTFIFTEQSIACAHYSLGGGKEIATLFRGPSEDASVAICVSDRGSLLHRNSGPWQVYCNEGDVNPIVCVDPQ